MTEQRPMSSYEDLFADPPPEEPPPRPGWLVPAILGGLVLALVAGAYGVGRLLSSTVDSDPSTEPAPLEMPETTGGDPNPVRGRAWDGDVRPLGQVEAASSCVLSPSTDAAGHRVTYTPDKAVDGDFSTAWRCAGDGRGVTVRLELGRRVRLAEVGLVPGYAKTDPRSGTDRYAENNRITEVRWRFPDGRTAVQKLDGSPTNRSVQTIRIPPMRTESLTVEVVSSVSGPRNTVAISEIQLARAFPGG